MNLDNSCEGSDEAKIPATNYGWSTKTAHPIFHKPAEPVTPRAPPLRKGDPASAVDVESVPVAPAAPASPKLRLIPDPAVPLLSFSEIPFSLELRHHRLRPLYSANPSDAQRLLSSMDAQKSSGIRGQQDTPHYLLALDSILDIARTAFMQKDAPTVIDSDDGNSLLSRMFAEVNEQAPKVVLSCLFGAHSALPLTKATIHQMDDILPSKRRQLHEECVAKWSELLQQFLMSCIRLNERLHFSRDAIHDGNREYLPLSRDIWQVKTENNRFLCRPGNSRSFIFFMVDFIMAFDEGKHLLVLACPLSGLVFVSPEDICIDKLLDEVPEPQVHFIARRLSQLTGISWEFGCLADCEMSHYAADGLRPVTDLFSGSAIDLEATSLGLLTGCEVGLIDEGRQEYAVGLKLSGSVFRLAGCISGIHYPEKADFVSIISNPNITDYLNVSTGGVHIHNLSFVPRNEDFRKMEGTCVEDPVVIHEMSLQLGYGQQMADALRDRAATMLKRREPVTLDRVQDSLLQLWRNASDRSMIPLSFRTRLRARKRDTFLILNSGKLYIAKAGKNISKSLTFGLNSDIAQALFGITWTDKKIETQGQVSSIFDAVAHLHGCQPNFDKGGSGWYKPNSPGMSEITGALTFLSVMLTGKVRPFGMFKNAVPRPAFSAESDNADLQSVCFDLPFSYGLTYTTFAFGFEPLTNEFSVPVSNFCTIGRERWDPCNNYSCPVVVGGPCDDEEVRSAVFADGQPIVHAAPVTSTRGRDPLVNITRVKKGIGMLPSLHVAVMKRK